MIFAFIAGFIPAVVLAAILEQSNPVLFNIIFGYWIFGCFVVFIYLHHSFHQCLSGAARK